MCRKYSAKENRSFWQQVDSGKPAEKIRIRGRKRRQVWRRLRELGLTAKRSFPPLTRAQRKKLRELVAQGFKAKDIAENHMLGEAAHLTNQNYIQKWMGKLGLVNKNRSRAAKKRRVFKQAESRGLNKFIVLHSSELSARQIAQKYRLKPEAVSSRQRQLGVKPSLPDVMQLPETRRRYLAGMRRRRARVLARFDAQIAERERRLTERYKTLFEGNKKRLEPLTPRTCKVCGKKWFKHKDFFYHNETKNGGFAIWSFSGTCVICEAKKRHQRRL